MASARAAASEKLMPLIAFAGMATRHPNQILLSCAPARIVPRLEPVGLFETDGTGGGAGAAPAPRPAGGACGAPAANVPSTTTAATAYILWVMGGQSSRQLAVK